MKPWIAVLLFCTVFIACDFNASDPAPPNLIRVGVLPDQSVSDLKAKYQPLLSYLSENTGIKFELMIPQDYSELVKWFEDKNIQLGYLGGFTFVQAHQNNSVVPLVFRDVDIRFTSSFLVKTNSTAINISDLKGKAFAFGSNLSTSGHLMPRYFLKEMKIEPENFFSEVKYSGKHDTTAYWVRDGKIDVGVANSKIVDQLFDQGKLNPKDIRVLWKTPYYADYVWAASSSLAPFFQTKIRNAFLSLSTKNPAHLNTLKHLGAEHFLPATSDEFSHIEMIARETGYLKKK